MATAKTATKKKAPVKKGAPKPTSVKKTSAKSRAVKKAPVKRTSAKRASASSQMRSFRLAQDQPPFTSFRVTRQTLYWVVLVAFIIFAQLWIINLQVEVASLIDAQQAQLQEL